MGKKRILIIDDDIGFQEMLTMRLEYNGYGCTSALTIKDGLSKLHELHPDMIILDLELPDGWGATFLDKAEDYVGKNTKIPPIIVLSCHDETKNIRYVLKHGAAKFMSKPYDPKKLLDTINENISSEQ